MRNPWTIVAWTSFVVLALAAPTRAADTDGTPLSDKEKIAQLEKRVQQMQEDLLKLTRQNLELMEQLRNRDSDDIKTRLKQIEERLDTISREARKSFSHDPTTDDVKARLLKVEERLDTLTRERRSFTIDPVTPGTPTGTVVLRNRLTVNGTVILNGVAYRLAPGETRTLSGVRAGEFTFEAVADGMGHLQQLVSRNLPANWTHTIDLVPTR